VRRLLQFAVLAASLAFVVLRLVASPNRRGRIRPLVRDRATQLAIPGRTTATVDVPCNTFGAAAGWLLARELWD
jgi:hypothetical protein